eukprot:TRINITY_DN43684_c0_g1_i1.p1 TRINITY_DN43684_c0_g1~~TRINITY_DN43684_c0_g1_i1.p1  ORF type:complete len:525 (+),score=70.73 TRINITY_DN43684_c0_g1_i1:234-1577(+)
MVFTIEYMSKLLLVGSCRAGVLDRENLLRMVVPESGASFLGTLRQTPAHRILNFMFRPMHIVDFIAILPFWLRVTLGTVTTIPLSFLRALRLLRLFRVMKLGKFDEVLIVLGATLAKSMQSVYVLALWVAVTCIIVGAILNQLEPENEVFRTVPWGSWYVLSRLVGCHSTAPFVVGKPATMAGGAIMTLVAFFKAILWIMPFGLISECFSVEWKKFNSQQLFKKQAAARKYLKPRSEWVESMENAVARVEILEGDQIKAMGELTIPVLEADWASDGKAEPWFEVPVTLLSHSMQSWFGSSTPMLSCFVQWEPAPESRPAKGEPVGTLSLKPLHGSNFSGGNQGWSCRFRVSETCSGSQEKVWTSEVSSGEIHSPQWDPDSPQVAKFKINWRIEGASGQAKQKSEGTAQKVSIELDALEANSEELAKQAALLSALESSFSRPPGDRNQ